jgi:type IV pilus assembly protein PilB
MKVVFRVDGMLDSAVTIPRRMMTGVVSRMKVMANLDIAERRVPQDGRVSLLIDGHEIDLRVVTLPSVHGESVVMRILDKESVVVDLDKLGMSPGARPAVRGGEPHGVDPSAAALDDLRSGGQAPPGVGQAAYLDAAAAEALAGE